jgi:CysZ protein
LLKDLLIALAAYAKAHSFIRQHGLWRIIFLPGLVYTFLFATSMYFFWHSANGAVQYINQTSGLAAWLDRINSGWVSFLVSFAELVLTLLLLLFYFSLFKYVWLIVGSPVFAYLSEKTEALITGKAYPFSLEQLLSDMWRGVKLALRNTLWQSVYTVAIIFLGLVPLVGWAAPLLALMIECYYYGFSMIDYSCERHRLSVGASIRFVSQRKGLAIGNGLVFYLMHLVPVLGWVAAPAYAVIAATISLHQAKSSSP